MENLKTILVASDLSPRADRALARAVRLAAQHDAALKVLHVVEHVLGSDRPPDNILKLAFGSPGEVETTLKQEAEVILNARVAAFPEAMRVRHRIEAKIGTPFLDIIVQARAAASDLVVLGAHGRGHLKDWLLGTTAERVVRKGDRPALVVKRLPEGPYRRVLVAVDFSDTSRRALLLAARLAPGAHLTLLHAYEFWYEARLTGMSTEAQRRLHQEYELWAHAQLVALAQEAGLDRKTLTLLVRRGYPATVIVNSIADQRADLVAIGTRGLTGLHSVLLGSVAAHVLREAECDVLAARPEALAFELP